MDRKRKRFSHTKLMGGNYKQNDSDKKKNGSKTSTVLSVDLNTVNDVGKTNQPYLYFANINSHVDVWYKLSV